MVLVPLRDLRWWACRRPRPSSRSAWRTSAARRSRRPPGPTRWRSAPGSSGPAPPRPRVRAALRGAGAGPRGARAGPSRGGDFVHSTPPRSTSWSPTSRLLRDAVPRGTRMGFVVGTLTPDGEVDAEVVRRLVAACGPAPVTFHKAFDSVPDQRAALALLRDLGVTRVLTSGGPGPAVDHLPALADLVRAAGDDVRVAVGGGVRPATWRGSWPHRGARGAPARAGSGRVGGQVGRLRRRWPQRHRPRRAGRGDGGARPLSHARAVSPGNRTARASGSTPDTSSSGNTGRSTGGGRAGRGPGRPRRA